MVSMLALRRLYNSVHDSFLVGPLSEYQGYPTAIADDVYFFLYVLVPYIRSRTGLTPTALDPYFNFNTTWYLALFMPNSR